MNIDKQKILPILLIIIALDYLVVGIFTIFVPNSFGDTTLIYSQISITVGLFILVVSSDPKNYHNFLWVIVIQDIGEVLVHINLILNETSYFIINVIVSVTHSIYIIALLLLVGRSIIPNFGKSDDSLKA